jgi:predicted flap endonuclease-1-like 5' DNA nuclease
MDLQSNGLILVLLIVLGAVAALIVAGMIYGRRLAHQRHRAEEAAEERAEEAGVELAPDEDAVAAETDATPVAKEPDRDATIAAPKPSPAPEPAPTPVPAPAPVEEVAPPSPPPPPAPVEEAAPPPASPTAAPDAAPEPAVTPDLAGALSLTTIKGLGPKVAAMLAERGITRVDQVAALTTDEASELDAQLGVFTGRMARDRWIDQAKLLASGDTTAYEAEFGKLG